MSGDVAEAVLEDVGYRSWSELEPADRQVIAEELARLGLLDAPWVRTFWWKVDGHGWTAVRPRNPARMPGREGQGR